MGKFFGWLLIVMGVLIAGTAGLCSTAVLVGDSSTRAYLGGSSTVALFGGIPFLFGIGCIFAGWVMRKGK